MQIQKKIQNKCHLKFLQIKKIFVGIIIVKRRRNIHFIGFKSRLRIDTLAATLRLIVKNTIKAKIREKKIINIQDYMYIFKIYSRIKFKRVLLSNKIKNFTLLTRMIPHNLTVLFLY